MKLNRLTLAIGTALLMPVTAVYAGGHTSSKGHDHGSKKHVSAPKFYGRLDIAIANYDPEILSDTASADFGAPRDAYFDVESYASRLGVKGTLDTNIVDMDIIYKYEFELNSFEDENDKSNESDMFKARNQYVGVKGAYGTFTIGRHDTAFKESQGKVDLFSDHRADIKHYLEGEDRVGDSINYVTPEYMGLRGTITLLSGEKNDSGDFIVRNEDLPDDENNSTKTAEDYTGVADGVSYAVSYTWGDYYFAIAGNSEVDKQDAIRFTSTAKYGDFGFGFIYQDSENSQSSDLGEQEGFVLSSYYKWGQTKFKFQYGSSEDKFNGEKISDIDALALGVDYKLAKPTFVYAEYTNLNNQTYNADDADRAREWDERTIALGIQHKF